MTPILLRVYLPCPSSIVRPPRPMAFRRLLTPQTRGAGERLPPPNPPRPHPSPVVACWGRPPPQQHPYPPPVPSSSSCVALGRLGRKLRYKVVVAWVLPPLSCLTPFSTWSLSPLLLGGGIGPRRGGGEDGYNGMARREERDSPWVSVLLPSFLFAPKDARPSGTPLNATYHVRPVFWGEKKVFVSRGWGRERRLFSSIKSLPRCLSFFCGF